MDLGIIRSGNNFQRIRGSTRDSLLEACIIGVGSDGIALADRKTGIKGTARSMDIFDGELCSKTFVYVK
jgi:hypothetical protein